MAEHADNLGGAEHVPQTPVASDDTSHGDGNIYYKHPKTLPKKQKKEVSPPVNLQLSQEARKLLAQMEEKVNQDELDTEDSDKKNAESSSDNDNNLIQD